MTSSGCEMDVGGRGPTANTMQMTIRSSALPRFGPPDISMMESTCKKLAFKFSTYRPLPPYVHLVSTHVMNAPGPSPFFFFAGLPLQCIIANANGRLKRRRFGNESMKTWLCNTQRYKLSRYGTAQNLERGIYYT